MPLSDVRTRHFLIEWIVLNLIGFLVGFWLGATDDNVITRLLGREFPILALADMVNAGTFGLAQYLVLRRYFPESRPNLKWWVPTSAVGFMIGARLAVRFAGFFTFQVLPFGLVFGIIIGGALGLVQWAAIKRLGMLQAEQPLAWIPISIFAWAVSEYLYSALGGNGIWIMPWFSFVWSLIVWVALMLWVRPR